MLNNLFKKRVPFRNFFNENNAYISEYSYDDFDRLIEEVSYVESNKDSITHRQTFEYVDNCYYKISEYENKKSKIYVCLDEFGRIIEYNIITDDFTERYMTIVSIYDEHNNFIKCIKKYSDGRYYTTIRKIEYY